MTVVDANYFLRYFVRPVTDHDRTMTERAAALFRLVRDGRETFTTGDAVVAEVVFILSSRRHYGLPRADVADLLRPLLRLPGCKFPGKRRCLRALDLWTARPNVSFVDALVATQAQELGRPLASFDAALARLPDVAVWQPPAAVDADSTVEADEP